MAGGRLLLRVLASFASPAGSVLGRWKSASSALYSLIVTLWSFATSCSQEIEKFARAKGMTFSNDQQRDPGG